MSNNDRSNEVILKAIEESDLRKVAEVHLSSFPDSALTKLGIESVRRYYLWQLTGQHDLVSALGAFVDDECAGFSFGGKFVASTSGFLRENRSFLVKEVLLHPWLIFNSLFISRLIYGVRILNRLGKKKNDSKKPTQNRPPSFGILSIGVSRNFQKLGIGKLLMLEAEKIAVEHGYHRMHLTVSPENENAIRFYEKLNWEKFLQDDSWKGVMIKTLD